MISPKHFHRFYLILSLRTVIIVYLVVKEVSSLSFRGLQCNFFRSCYYQDLEVRFPSFDPDCGRDCSQGHSGCLRISNIKDNYNKTPVIHSWVDSETYTARVTFRQGVLQKPARQGADETCICVYGCNVCTDSCAQQLWHVQPWHITSGYSWEMEQVAGGKRGEKRTSFYTLLYCGHL